MHIRKDDRKKGHFKVALIMSSFLLMILGVTLWGMTVFTPQHNGTNSDQLTRLSSKRPLIGSPTASAADDQVLPEMSEELDGVTDSVDEKILPDLDEELDGLADSLEDIIHDARGTNTNSEEEQEKQEEQKKTADDKTDLNKKTDVETAVEAGTAAWNLWALLWDVLWPKMHTFAGALWSAFASG